jgi:hypothetical protein
MGKKILGYVLVAFLAFYVLKNPTGAATTARHIGSGLANLATSLGEFMSAVTGGGGHR